MRGPGTGATGIPAVPVNSGISRSLLESVVSRVLFLPRVAPRKAMIISLAGRLLARSCDLPGSLGRAALERFPIWSCSVWGLPCLGCRHPSGALLPHLFTLTASFGSGGMFSVALSFRSPGLAVNQHTALWSSDFPLAHPPGRSREKSQRPSDRLEQANALCARERSYFNRLVPARSCTARASCRGCCAGSR